MAGVVSSMRCCKAVADDWAVDLEKDAKRR